MDGLRKRAIGGMYKEDDRKGLRVRVSSKINDGRCGFRFRTGRLSKHATLDNLHRETFLAMDPDHLLSIYVPFAAMSLYYDGAAVLAAQARASSAERPTVQSLIFNRKINGIDGKALKSSPKQLYALVTEATKWSPVLKEVVEKSEILRLEKKLTPVLALLLTHDLLLSKGGIAAPTNHVLALAVNRHKARLRAEFTKLRLKRGFGSIEEFRQDVDGSGVSSHLDTQHNVQDSNRDSVTVYHHPRWIRINVLLTNLQEQLESTFAAYTQTKELRDVMIASSASKILYVDRHIPNLLALPPRADFTKTAAYKSGHIIFQDKASCFPAYLLDPKAGEGDIIDACAAPGNKTTHLAAIVMSSKAANPARLSLNEQSRLIACERDKTRAEILKKMVKIAGADVTIKAGQDFLKLDSNADKFSNVEALLLDPSCSGSGIVGRDDAPTLLLPEVKPAEAGTGKKRKRKAPSVEKKIEEQEEDEDTVNAANESKEKLAARLKALSDFQLTLLSHALSFPEARRVTYSTCSIHAEENERVVVRALLSDVAKKRGWRVLRRGEQVEGMRAWEVRGLVEECGGVDGVEAEMIAEACIRTEKGTAEGTMGFFVAGFVRNEEEAEWSGFDDDH